MDKAQSDSLDESACLRGGIARVGNEGTPEQVTQFYNDNAADYKIAENEKYDDGCRALAAAMLELVPDTSRRILDCAAGTGFAGEELRKLGYDNVDALDPSEGMLDIARSKGIYRNYIIDIVSPDEKNTIEDGTYDGIIIMGSVQPGHISVDCLPELTRMTKKGGGIVFNIADKYSTSDPNFHGDKIGKLFQTFIDDGSWTKWEAIRAIYRYQEDCSIYRIVVA